MSYYNASNVTYNTTYNGFPINTNHNKGQGCFTNILNRYYAHLLDMINNHSKVLQVRFDLHYPQDCSIIPHNQHIHDFNYNLQRKLHRSTNKGRHSVDPRLILAVEQHGNSSHPHMHGILLINGNAKQDYMFILIEVEKQWRQAIGSSNLGLVDFCNRFVANGIMIDRNKIDFQERLNSSFFQASYIAKLRGKEHRSKGSWTVYGTRVPQLNVS